MVERRPHRAASATSRAHAASPARPKKPAVGPRGSQPPRRHPTGNRAGRPATQRRRSHRIPLADPARRLHIALVAIGIALSLCAGRLLQLQGFDSSAYAAMSTEQLTRTLPLLPSRGQITDRNGVVLASTQAAVAITADPTLTAPNAQQIADLMLRYLQADRAALVSQLTKPNTRFVYLKKKVPALTYAAISAALAEAKLPGVFRESDPIRTYPGRKVAASVIGFVGADGKGLAGLERSLNAELAGTEGKETYESAPNGSKIPLGSSVVTPAKNGLNYQTTIDSELQWAAEQLISTRVRVQNAESGFAITMNVKNGEILALATAPGFDASHPGDVKPEQRRNVAVEDAYEPGSVEKLLTAAALIDSDTAVGGQQISPTTRVRVPNRLPSGGGFIKDHFEHGTLKLLMRGVIAESSNIGTALLARQMDKATLQSYLKKFGLGQQTGLEVPNEAAGILPPATMKDYTRDQIAFGQAVAVTGVQEAAAIAAIVNGGTYYPPTLIKGATDSDGKPVAVPRRASRQVITPQTSKQVRNMMAAVVHNNRLLVIDGYNSIGKTGTAQVINESCGCYRGYVVSYVAVAPAENPSILTYVVVRKPKHGSTGSGVAAPVVRDVMRTALPRYSFPPSTKSTKPQALEYR